jgi:hypothetical protein
LELENNKLILSVLGALLTAVIGGAVWAVIAILTEYEIGLVAWAIGGMAGYAVFYLARKKISAAHQVIAVIASLIGILLGKYFIFGYYYNGSISGIFEGEVVTLFQDNIAQFFGGMDIIFVILAVVTAWQLPSKLANRAALTEPTVNAAE